MAVQKQVACRISRHPHNSHIAPLLAPGSEAKRCCLARVPGLLWGYRVSNAPVMLLLSAKTRNFRSFPSAPSLAGCLCLIAWLVLFCPISCQLLCVSPACQSFLPTLCSLFLQLSASCGVSFSQSFQWFFSIYVQRHCCGFSGIGAFQVLNEVAHKSGEC